MRIAASLVIALSLFGCGGSDKTTDTNTGTSTTPSGTSDVDGDGFDDSVDCNDNDDAVNPDATEICDGVDNNCDGATDEADGNSENPWYPDADGDGYGAAGSAVYACTQPADHADNADDCDDATDTVSPEVAEVCANGIDDDCDSATTDLQDGDADGSACDLDCDDADATVFPGASEVCGNAVDDDCDPATLDIFDGDSDTAMCDVDCDDADPAVFPGNMEVCDNGIDDDCDAVTTDIYDNDGDGSTCDADCNDAEPGEYPGNVEVCENGLDDDCDGMVDCPAACPSEGFVTLPVHASGTDFAADFTANDDWGGGVSCTSASGAEATYEIDLLAGDELKVIEHTSTFDGVVRLTSACDPGLAECLESQDFGDTFTHTIAVDGTYFVVIESWGDASGDAYDFDIGLVAPEVCDDGIDNDLNGLTDCDDFDSCFDTIECPFTCPTGGVSTLPVYESGSDFGADFGINYDWSGGLGCSSATGAEAVYELDLLAGDEIRAVEYSAALDAVIRLVDSCNPTAGECLESADFGDSFTHTIAADGTYFVVIESWGNADGDAYEFEINLIQPEDCGDGVDNDVDGDVDCDDSDCFGDPTYCTTEDGFCADGLDNDGDGTYDCVDTDCSASAVCGAGTLALYEEFDSGIPMTWTVVDGGTDTTGADTWQWCPGGACASDALTGSNGGYVFSDSDAGGSGSSQDEQLISPAFDLSGATEAAVIFTYYWRAASGDLAVLQTSTNGIDWNTQGSLTSGLNGDMAAIDISDVAGAPNVQLRFLYTASWDWYWLLDDVEVYKN